MNEQTRQIFTGMQILQNQTWLQHHAIVVEHGKITAMIAAELIKHHLPAKLHHYPENYYLAPGFIDLHVHGTNGADVMDATPKALEIINHALVAEGITGFLVTTMTASEENIENALQNVAQAKKNNNQTGILGIHLEGPFITKECCGAQPADYIRAPSFNHIDTWQKKAEGLIKMVTLAPELPGAIELIEKIKNLGIIAAIGHTNATYAETEKAINAGCTHATHLFNAMRPIRQREPGVAVAVLLAHEVSAELIVDNVHLHPAMVDMALKLKGKQKIQLVTDSMRAKCMPDGEYDLGGQTVYVKEGKASLADGTIAGSTLSMIEAIKNITTSTNCSLAEAFTMASYNPATVLRLANQKGSIAVGKDADLVILNPDLKVVHTFRDGQEIYKL